ncbi:hypothetical protein BOX15_Mlig008939g1 [Macrostomum lignano]|uniref:Uncharacterized protein n=1 Tax=Macrostomum lignano TaxID=282301 RepID=A0A267EJK1_9PLAT|nr:hypothetical protein BOX15_Mlig008939g1 [Macrostomum lignano]
MRFDCPKIKFNDEMAAFLGALRSVCCAEIAQKHCTGKNCEDDDIVFTQEDVHFNLTPGDGHHDICSTRMHALVVLATELKL